MMPHRPTDYFAAGEAMMAARAFRFGTGRLVRLSLVRTRRVGAMMRGCHTDASAVQSGRGWRHIPVSAGRHEPEDCHNAVVDLPDLGKERRNWR